MIKKTLFMVLLCLTVTFAKSQRLEQVADYEYITDVTYATKPVLSLDSLTGYLSYSYTVTYPSGATRDDVEWGGAYYTVALVNNFSQNILLPIDFNNETWDATELPNGQVVYSGSIYIGHLYNDLNLIAVSYSHGYSFFSKPYDPRYASGYQEYYFFQ